MSVTLCDFRKNSLKWTEEMRMRERKMEMDCIFCKIVDGAIPAKKVYESDTVLAFNDINPAAPVHVLVIPKKHIASMEDAAGEDFALLADALQATQQIARELGVAESGYRIVNNCGKNGGQEVFHIHLHLLAGAKLAPLVAASRENA